MKFHHIKCDLHNSYCLVDEDGLHIKLIGQDEN